MTIDSNRWVGKDVHLGPPSLDRPDAPKAKTWSLEAVAAVERAHHPSVSPDGTKISFVLDRDTSDVWTVGIGGGWPLRATIGRDPTAYWADSPAPWSPDGLRLAYTAAGSVWVIDAAGGTPRAIAEGWSPVWVGPGSMLIVAERDEVSRLCSVELDDPWPRPLTPPGQEVSGVSLAPDGNTAFYVVDPKEDRQTSEIWACDLSSGDCRMLVTDTGAHARGPRPSPNGLSIAFVSEEPGWYEVFIADDTGSLQLTSDGHDFSDLDWSHDGSRLSAVRSRHDTSELVVIEVETGGVAVLSAGGTWADPQWVGDEIVATHEDHRTPPRLVMVGPGGEVTNLLGPPPSAVSAAVYVGYETVTYRSFDGMEIPGLLFQPESATVEEPVAAVVYPHGGPTSAYVDEWDGHAQYFIDKGYAWFAVNFRGSTGYGREFERANHGVWGVADTEDCLAAADYLAGLDWVDANRIAIFGASYGSYMALAALALDPEHRYACGVLKYGDSDIISSWAMTDREGREDLERMMGAPKEDREAYRKGSPLWQVENIERPMLIAHGEQDERVHPDQSSQLVDELRRLNKRFEYVTYPTEGHGLLRTGPQVHFYKRLERFLDWHLM